MENKKYYIVSFGDSNKYKVAFDGTKDELKNSEMYKNLKETVEAYLKGKFPGGGYTHIVEPVIEEDKGDTDYPDLNSTAIDDLLKSLALQVTVEKDTDELNLNAPFDKI